MKLITKADIKKIPALGSTEFKSPKNAVVKFFTPDSNWTWYVVEGGIDTEEGTLPLTDLAIVTPNDVIFFGLVEGQEKEWGYFSLGELLSIRGPFGLPVERDRYFEGKEL